MILNHKTFQIINGKSFDLFILGGGINGVSILKEATERGYTCLLVDNNDFSRGATAHSSRLIHGGLRYLEYFEFGLVYESLSARSYLLKNFPHLVKPLNLNIPVFKSRGRPSWMIKAGLILYDLLSIKKTLPNHKKLSLSEFENLFPQFDNSDLKTVYSYFDAQIEWPERLVFQILNSVPENGISANYTSISDYEKKDNDHHFCLSSLINGESVSVSSKMVINAAGSWVDLANLKLKKNTIHTGGTKGSHIVYSIQMTPPSQAIYVEAKQDGRPFFILPWNGMTLIGTTDIFYHDSLDRIIISEDEKQYIETELKSLFTEFTPERVHYTFSGIRPLPKVDPKHSTSKITRKHSFNRLNSDLSMIDVIGGKLTTFPALSQDLLKLADLHFKRKTASASFFSKDKPFIYQMENLKNEYKRLFLRFEVHLNDKNCERLVSFYGSDLLHFCSLNEDIRKDDFKKLHLGLSQYLVEIKYCIHTESVFTWSDLFERRTDIAADIGFNIPKWNEVFEILKTNHIGVDSSGMTKDEYLNEFVSVRFPFKKQS